MSTNKYARFASGIEYFRALEEFKNKEDFVVSV